MLLLPSRQPLVDASGFVTRPWRAYFEQSAWTSGTNSGDVTVGGVHSYITVVGQVLTLTAIDLTTDVDGRLPYANLTASAAAARLLGRGDAGAGDWQEITLGTNLAMSGTTLNAASYTPATQTVRKTADETVTNSSALQDDDHLALAVGANEVWLVELFLLVTTNTTADLKVGWTGPSGATFQWGSGAWAAVAAGSSAELLLGIGDVLVCGGSGGTHGVHLTGICAVGANAGTLQLQWAQDTADASDTKVLTNSVLRATVLTG